MKKKPYTVLVSDEQVCRCGSRLKMTGGTSTCRLCQKNYMTLSRYEKLSSYERENLCIMNREQVDGYLDAWHPKRPKYSTESCPYPRSRKKKLHPTGTSINASRITSYNWKAKMIDLGVDGLEYMLLYDIKKKAVRVVISCSKDAIPFFADPKGPVCLSLPLERTDTGIIPRCIHVPIITIKTQIYELDKISNSEVLTGNLKPQKKIASVPISLQVRIPQAVILQIKRICGQDSNYEGKVIECSH